MTLTFEPDPESVKLNKHTKKHQKAHQICTSKIIYFKRFCLDTQTHIPTALSEPLKWSAESSSDSSRISEKRQSLTSKYYKPLMVSIPRLQSQDLNPTYDSELYKMLAKSNMHSYIKTWNLWHHKKFSMRSEQTNKHQMFSRCNWVSKPSKASEFGYRLDAVSDVQLTLTHRRRHLQAKKATEHTALILNIIQKAVEMLINKKILICIISILQ